MLKATDHPSPGLLVPTRRGHPALPTPQKAGSREASTSWPGRRGPASRGALSNTPSPRHMGQGTSSLAPTVPSRKAKSWRQGGGGSPE